MNPYNPPGSQAEPSHRSQFQEQQQAYGPSTASQPPDDVQEPQPISEMTVSTPTLRWVSIDHPAAQVPLGPDDYVLNSVYNPQLDAWEVLVIVQPRDEEGDDE